MRLAAPALLALAVLAACAPPPPGPAGPRGTYEGPTLSSQPRAIGPRGFPVIEASASGAELSFAASLLAGLQARSFAENREFCGYIGLDDLGQWTSTPVSVGDEASCPLPYIPRGLRIAASGRNVHVLYRAATAMVHRDIHALQSSDRGRTTIVAGSTSG